MQAAAVLGHFGGGRVDVGPQQVGTRHALLGAPRSQHRFQRKFVAFHGATSMAMAARLWAMGATVAASWRRKWSIAGFNLTARSTVGLVPFT